MLTLFSKSPLPAKINSQIVEQFGYKVGDHKVLYSTITASSRNTIKGKPGFRLKCTRSEIKIAYAGKPNPYWDKKTLEKVFNKKFPLHMLYVKANSKGRGESEKFHYDEAWLLSGSSFTRFVKMLKKGEISVNLRLGKRDHGTAFRISPKKLDRLFKIKKKVI